MKKNFSVAIDLDDTISDFVSSWLKYYNYKSGDNLSKDKITDWNISKFVLPKWKKKIYDLANEKCIYEQPTIKDGSQEIIEWLLTKANVYIITAYLYYSAIEPKVEWIKTNLPFFPVENIIFSNHKNIFNIDYLIDDKYENVNNFNGCGILFQNDTPWNQKHTDHWPTVHNWQEVKEFFENEIELTK